MIMQQQQQQLALDPELLPWLKCFALAKMFCPGTAGSSSRAYTTAAAAPSINNK